MSLPYENATSGKNAIAETQKILRKFGAESFGHLEDFQTGELLVQFTYRDRKISVKANAKGYAAAYLKHHPYTTGMRATKNQHEARALKQGNIAVCSVLRDWIKGQITAIETGIMSFEGAFLGQIMLQDGRTVLERVQHDNILQITSD